MWLISLLAASIASAGIVCPPSSKALMQMETLRQDIFYNGPGPDPRQNFEKFAEEEREPVERTYEKYAFAGQLFCRGFTGSVNLSGKGDVLTTVAHNFYGSNGKRLNFGGSRCVARFKAGPGQPIEEYEIDESTLVVGTKTPKEVLDHLDWAVVKLKKPVNNIKPVAIPKTEILSKGQIALAASGPQTDHLDGKDIFNAPNLLHRCTAKVVLGDNLNERTARTNCALGNSGSGSSLVQENGMNPILLGLAVRSSEDSKSGAAYNEKLAMSVYVPLEGQFLSALKAATGL